jgi:Na+/H+-translocating membrane pyrophosphatase
MSTFGLSVALEMSSAIFDNALAIADMAGVPDDSRSAVAALALAGRSVAATSKSLSIASATLAGIAAWAAFNFTAQVTAGPTHCPTLLGCRHVQAKTVHRVRHTLRLRRAGSGGLTLRSSPSVATIESSRLIPPSLGGR